MASLGTIKPGDIVKVDKKGREFHAIAGEKEDGKLQISPLESAVSYRSATAREVVAHWRKTKNGRTS